MNDMTVAISESALKEVFGALVEVFQFELNKSGSGSPRFAVHVKCHLKRGSFSLVPPDPHNPIYKGGYFNLTDVIVDWDNLDLTATVHIPKVGWGSVCIVNTPLGCAVEIPGASFFDTDISAGIAIDDVLRSRIDLGMAPLSRHIWNGDDKTYQWLVVPQIVHQNVQPIDVPDTVADLINGLIKKLIDEAMRHLPDWAKDIVDTLVGGLANFIRVLLGVPTNLKVWLEGLLRYSLNPLDLIFQILENCFQNNLSLYTMDDPVEVLPKETSPVALPRVMMPISGMNLRVEATEFVIGVTP
jgi:hypothetical protein